MEYLIICASKKNTDSFRLNALMSEVQKHKSCDAFELEDNIYTSCVKKKSAEHIFIDSFWLKGAPEVVN